MIQSLLSIFAIFPISFIVFSLSERITARHESRVGKQISLLGFIWQTWVDTRVELRALKLREWLGYVFPLFIVILYGIDAEFLIFPYLAILGFILVHQSNHDSQVLERISSDRQQVSFAVASAIAAVCLLGAFTLSKTTNMATLLWNPGHLIFIVPFQLAGMILFGEEPFLGFKAQPSWIRSARFYAWSMLTTKVFLGGGDYFFDFQIKTMVLFLCSRLLAIYFPSVRQKDLLRVSILYFLPITGVLWLVMMMIRALMGEGGLSV
jgi:hypothetical protein